MKKKVTKWMAGISSVVMLASFSALSVPAFDEEAYVASFENEKAQTVARYFLDNGFSMKETEEMMGWYLDGLAIIEDEQNANTKKPYYNGRVTASSQHYGTIIISNPEAKVRGSLWLTGVSRGEPDYFAFTNAETENVKLNGYEGIVTVGQDDSVMSYTFLTKTNTSGSNMPLAMCKFPVELGAALSSEASVYNAVTRDSSLSRSHSNGVGSTFQFHIYALGDFDHNGVLDDADYNYIVDYALMSFDGKFEYTDVGTQVAYQVNKLAADVNSDGVVDMQDAIALGKIING